MGTSDGQQPLFYVGVNLEGRIPHDHSLRLVKQQIDFSFVRREVAHLYGRNGNLSIDPVVILKLVVSINSNGEQVAPTAGFEMASDLPFSAD